MKTIWQLPQIVILIVLFALAGCVTERYVVIEIDAVPGQEWSLELDAFTNSGYYAHLREPIHGIGPTQIEIRHAQYVSSAMYRGDVGTTLWVVHGERWRKVQSLDRMGRVKWWAAYLEDVK